MRGPEIESCMIWYRYSTMPDSGSLDTVQVAWRLVSEVVVAPSSVTVTALGAVVSSTMVSDAAADQLPAASLNLANTVFVPSPVASVQAFVVAYASGAE